MNIDVKKGKVKDTKGIFILNTFNVVIFRDPIREGVKKTMELRTCQTKNPFKRSRLV